MSRNRLRYRELARAILDDAQDAARSYKLKLELLNAFIVRRSAAIGHLTAPELSEMREVGLIREARSQSGENIYVIKLPELMASELSALISNELISRTQNDPEEAADWLAGAASNLPLGDIIAANALFDAAVANRGLNIQVLVELRKRPPQRKALAPGSHFATFLEGIGVVDMVVREDGAMLIEHNGEEIVMEQDPNDHNGNIVRAPGYSLRVKSCQLLGKARQAEPGSHMSEWLSSPGLQSPTNV